MNLTVVATPTLGIMLAIDGMIIIITNHDINITLYMYINTNFQEVYRTHHVMFICSDLNCQESRSSMSINMSSTLSELLAVHGLEENDLKQKMSVDHWQEFIVDWKSFGAVIGFDRDELDIIDDMFDSTELKQLCLYDEWTKRHEENATYLKLAEQLLTGEQRNLLDYLCGILARESSTADPASSVVSGWYSVYLSIVCSLLYSTKHLILGSDYLISPYTSSYTIVFLSFVRLLC